MNRLTRTLLATTLLALTTLCLSPLFALADEEFTPPANNPPTVMTFLSSPKYMIMVGLMAVALVLLLLRKVNLWVRLAGLVTAFVLYGLDKVFGLHPSPMCATTNLYMFRFVEDGRWVPVFVAFFLVMFVPSLFGKKLFCGWVCPLGALQELINKIPHKYKIKQPSFPAFNGVRFALLAMFFITFYGVKTHVLQLGTSLEADTSARMWKMFSAYSLYDPINMFHLLHWTVDTTFVVLMSIMVVASLVLYRPFCYIVCPIGAITWLFEQIAPGRIRVDMDKCNSCGQCLLETPCPTMEPLVAGKTWNIPDCTSCGECLPTCSQDAISFGFAPRK